MKTVTLRTARAHLPELLEDALNGTSVGIEVDGRIVALSPVPEEYQYALREYGVTPEELERFEKRIKRRIVWERRAGRLHSPEEAFGIDR